MSEKSLEAKARREIIKLGGFLIKWTAPGFAGVPDRIALLPWRRIYLLEFKAKNGVLSKIQIAVHAMFAAIGWKVYVISTDEQLENFIQVVA
jgi:hypothetical protein